MLYTLQKAAKLLCTTVGGVRKRIARYGVEPILLTTDNRRLYLTHNDLLLLMQKPEREPSTNNSSEEEQQLYTTEETAWLLGVSQKTVRKWIAQDKIEKKKQPLDKRLIYLSSKDLILLAKKHKRKLRQNIHQDSKTNQTGNTQEEQKLYSLTEAAQYLNSTPTTVRQWIAEHNIQKKMIVTDRKRAYIAHKDVLLLAQEHKRRKTQKKQPDRAINLDSNSQEGPQLYTMAEIALALHIPKSRVKKWIAEFNIPKTIIATDRKRVYVSYQDIVTIAEKLHHKIPKHDNAGTATSQDNNSQQEQKLYNLAETAIYLRVSQATLRKWLKYENIQKTIIATDRTRIYISFEDILRLADIYLCKISRYTDPTGFVAEIEKKELEILERAAKILKQERETS